MCCGGGNCCCSKVVEVMLGTVVFVKFVWSVGCWMFLIVGGVAEVFCCLSGGSCGTIGESVVVWICCMRCGGGCFGIAVDGPCVFCGGVEAASLAVKTKSPAVCVVD